MGGTGWRDTPHKMPSQGFDNGDIGSIISRSNNAVVLFRETSNSFSKGCNSIENNLFICMWMHCLSLNFEDISISLK